MLPLPIAPLLLATNALLDREPWATQQLQRHAGKVVVLHLDARSHAFRINHHGRLAAAASDNAAVSVYVSTGNLLQLLRGNAQDRLQAIRIEGEADLTHTLSELATHLRPDLEEELSRWVGDLAARRLAELGRHAWREIAARTRALHENLVEYAVYEANHLPQRAEVEHWQGEVELLNERTQQLLTRVAALQATDPPRS